KGKAPPAAVLELTFPRSKSWVECVATLNDPDNEVREVYATLPLLLEGKPALVDFGAGTGVYTTLRKRQRGALPARGQGGEGGQVLTGDEKKMSPFVLPAAGSTTKAEGWAHVMDSQRATAVAVDGFGLGVKDAIQVSGSGDLLLERQFPKGHKGPKVH